MEAYFSKFRKNIIGADQCISTPFHEAVRILYADWTASGRNYMPIEKKLIDELMPYVANTHTDSNHTGMAMTYAYHHARELIKKHVHASEHDVLISANSGMTGVVNKFQRILGLRLHESFKERIELTEHDRPIVFVSHMEHHSNQTSWLETIADLEIIPADEQGLVSTENFKELLHRYRNRKTKIVAMTSCSNVTGIMTPYSEIAKIMHDAGGLCFIDFACSAPYVDMDMHPDDGPGAYLDAIYFSPHKFLGGPGSSGILIFNRKLYNNSVPDNSGGGTVDWTNPWGQLKYVDNIEQREDAGTPAFLQTIRAAMCIKLKDEMGVKNILKREEQILGIIWPALTAIPNLEVLASQHRHRLGVFSFLIDGLHYNLGVKLLNDKFGIQTRGGCSCAGTYGHYLLNVDSENSYQFTRHIDHGDCSLKPGWIRMSVHPTHTDAEIRYLVDSIRELAENFREWSVGYQMDWEHNRVITKDASSEVALQRTIERSIEEGFV